LRLALLTGLLAGLLALPRWILGWSLAPRIYSLEQPPEGERPYAIVFGAGLRRNGQPTVVLSDRVGAAAQLYHLGLVRQLLMSGTKRDGYDEPLAMAREAQALGVPAEAIVLDEGGTRTLETCRRARDVFAIDSAYLVTQRYHLPRALVTCDGLGLAADGLAADLRSYRGTRYWALREIPATLVALVEAYLTPDGSASAHKVPMIGPSLEP
jgi:vancomycin permeability regulator SanA